jgi:hypothetical protein
MQEKFNSDVANEEKKRSILNKKIEEKLAQLNKREENFIKTYEEKTSKFEELKINFGNLIKINSELSIERERKFNKSIINKENNIKKQKTIFENYFNNNKKKLLDIKQEIEKSFINKSKMIKDREKIMYEKNMITQKILNDKNKNMEDTIKKLNEREKNILEKEKKLNNKLIKDEHNMSSYKTLISTLNNNATKIIELNKQNTLALCKNEREELDEKKVALESIKKGLNSKISLNSLNVLEFNCFID